jgi:hypothetical protein
MKDEDVKKFLEDFKKAEIDKKLDMWYYALDQEGLWEEILEEMSSIATALNLGQKKVEVKE